MLTALAVLVAVVLMQEWRADRLKKQVTALISSRDLHARALRYSAENAARGVHITRMDTARSLLVWVAYGGLAGEIYAPQALQKIRAGQWERVPSLSGPGQVVYQYRAPAAPGPGAEQR